MASRIFLLMTIIFLEAQSVFGQIDNSWVFKNELISYMESPKDTIYIQDRKKLYQLNHLGCNDTSVTFNSVTKTGENISIFIANKKFIAANHSLDLEDTVYKFIHNEKQIDYVISKDLIDGKRAYGLTGSYPGVELSEVTIKWGKIHLAIPDSAFHDLYNVHLCSDSTTHVDAYLTLDNKLLYIYVTASDASGSYSVKFVFNNKRYITRIFTFNEMTDGYDFLDAIAEEEE